MATPIDRRWKSLVDAVLKQKDHARKTIQNISAKVAETRMTGIHGGKDRISGTMSQAFVGRMVAYRYQVLEESHKRMPYWDAHPLIIVTDVVSGGWAGLNLHYLPPRERIQVLHTLYTIYGDDPNTNHFNEAKKLKASYQFLRQYVAYYSDGICYRRYRPSGLRSGIYVVPPDDWARVAVLPFQRFQKRSANFVWNETRKKLRGL